MTTPLPDTFNVDIFFIGILGVVTDTASPPGKVALLVPATDLGKEVMLDKGAADEKPLYRHRCFVEFSPRQLAGGTQSVPTDTCAHWTVSQQGRFFRMTFISDIATGLTVADNALDFISDMALVAPDYADIDPALLTWNPGPDVGGQIMFDRGTLKPPEIASSTWAFPPTLRLKQNPEEYQLNMELSHQIHLRLENLTRFAINVRSEQYDTAPQFLTLRGTQSDPVVISVCNLCDVNPMRWPTEAQRRVDDDFRWYYQLSKNKHTLRSELAGLDLPVPHPFTDGGGVGQNCLENRYASQNFTID